MSLARVTQAVQAVLAEAEAEEIPIALVEQEILHLQAQVKAMLVVLALT
jgi:hypothetical protein